MPILTNPGKHCYSCDDPEMLEKALQRGQVSLSRTADMDDQGGQVLDHVRTWRKAFFVQENKTCPRAGAVALLFADHFKC